MHLEVRLVGDQVEHLGIGLHSHRLDHARDQLHEGDDPRLLVLVHLHQGVLLQFKQGDHHVVDAADAGHRRDKQVDHTVEVAPDVVQRGFSLDLVLINGLSVAINLSRYHGGCHFHANNRLFDPDFDRDQWLGTHDDRYLVEPMILKQP